MFKSKLLLTKFKNNLNKFSLFNLKNYSFRYSELLNNNKNYNDANVNLNSYKFIFPQISLDSNNIKLNNFFFIDNNNENFIEIKGKYILFENELVEKIQEEEREKIEIIEFKNKTRNLAARKRKKRKTGKKISLRWK
jgi:hypothetical protein